MQRDLASIEAAGLHVVGISYDSPAVLKTFSEKSKITYSLLSDAGSKTIDDYHIRNDATKGKGKTDGIPHPGTYLVDTKGVIRAKLFLSNFRERHSSEQLIEAAKALK